jgi:hypothetical protein
MGEIPQTMEVVEAGKESPALWTVERVVEEIERTEVEKLVKDEGVTVSSAFVIWKGEEVSRKPRLVCNFKEMSQR